MASKNPVSVLILEDHPQFGEYLKRNLSTDYGVELVTTGDEAINAFKNGTFEIVLLDLGVPRRSKMAPEPLLGFEVLAKIKGHDPLAEVIILTGTAREIDNAIESIKRGAFYFLIKDDFEAFLPKLQMMMRNAIDKRRLSLKQKRLLSQASYFASRQKKVHKHLCPDLTYHFDLLVGESLPMHELYATIKKLSKRGIEETVLIQGEPGTGKELVALSIHSTSSRSTVPWIVANIASLSDNLIESELFGIEKKTATDVDERIGFFEQADGTSLFLDEIGDVSLNTQVKLLRALQEKEILRVGSTKPIPIDTRIIAATNKNLEKLIAEAQFREDLFFRLNIIPLIVPPLRERKEDIPLLVRHYLHAQQKEEQNDNIRFADDALERLQNYHWPGNVRELDNIIKRVVILRNDDCLRAEDVSKFFQKNHIPSVASNPVLHRLPEPILKDGQNGSSLFKETAMPEQKSELFLSTLIEREGHMEAVIDVLSIARNTGYKQMNEVQDLLLSGLCLTGGEVKALADTWGVCEEKLEKTIRKANRLANHLKSLHKKYNNDLNRISAYLKVDIEQLERVESFIAPHK